MIREFNEVTCQFAQCITSLFVNRQMNFSNTSLEYCHFLYLPFTDGKQIGLIESDNCTRSLSFNNAISLSKLRKLKSPVNARTTYLVSALYFSSHLSCSPNVTFIMNHINLKKILSIIIIIINIFLLITHCFYKPFDTMSSC